MAATIHLLNGPNLNRLGTREPSIYGAETLADIVADCRIVAEREGFSLVDRQSNIEGELVGFIHQAVDDGAAAVIINAGAYTHTSVALHDALRLLTVPIVETHLSNVHRREAFRHHSSIAPAATGIVMGFGALSYRLAVLAVCEMVRSKVY